MRSRLRHFVFRSVLPRLGYEPLFHMNLDEKAWPTISAITSKLQYRGNIESVDCGPNGYDEGSGVLEEYARKSHPVVLKGYVNTLMPWSVDKLRQEIGNINARIRVGEYDDARGAPDIIKISVGSFLDHLQGNGELAGQERHVEGKGPYLASQIFPTLAKQLPLPKFFTSFPKTTFWLGTDGRSPLHCHVLCDVLLTQLIGKRRVMLVPPHQAPLVGCIPRNINVCTGSYDPFESDADNFPGAEEVHKLYYELSAGDTLLIPGFWFLAVRLPNLSFASSQFNDAAMPLALGGGPRAPWMERPYKNGWG